MSPAPGVTVTSRSSQAGAAVATDEGTAFMAGISERGPTTDTKLIRNLDQFVQFYGPRVTYSLLYDAAEAFFREGGSRLYIGRVVGPAPTVSTVNAPDGATASIRFDAVNPGNWGAGVTVQISGQNKATVRDDGIIVEESPTLTDKASLVAWSQNSNYIRAVDIGAGAFPDDSTYALAGGGDDRTNITDTQWLNALETFAKDLGPGQVCAPGQTTEARQQQLLTHAETHNRVALCDLADTVTTGTLTAAVLALNNELNARYGAAFAPWVVIPGLTAGTTRVVPPSPVVAGIIARTEAEGNNSNVAAAGDNGVSLSAIDLSQDPWTDTQRATLNDAGVNVIRPLRGTFRVYGFRSVVDPINAPAFLQFSAAREFMSLSARCTEALEAFVFGQVDGKGVFFSQVTGALRAICLEDYNAGALYGDTPEEAFDARCDESTSTPAQIAAGEIHAVVEAKVSPFAERVVLEIVKVANTEAMT